MKLCDFEYTLEPFGRVELWSACCLFCHYAGEPSVGRYNLATTQFLSIGG